ncbi:MAG: PIN domain-containing protein [bacterium]|nr:PIN domain-containing protein [bacterium]
MLVDTSVWVDHFRNTNAALAEHLDHGDVWCHPFVIGELACGNLARRDEVLSLLAALPQVPEARHAEVLALIESHRLMGRGIGWIDVHLLASTRIGGTQIWTLDQRLAAAARELGIRAEP